MENKRNILLSQPVKVLFFLSLLFAGLYFAKPFLVPVCLAWLLTLLLLPVANKLEEKKWNRALSTLACVLMILAAIALIATLLSLQLKGLAQDSSRIESSVKDAIHKTQGYISNYFGVPPDRQEEMVKKQAQSGGGAITGVIMGAVGDIFGVLGNFILVMVYIFLFLYYRARFRKFVFKAVSQDNRGKADAIINETAQAIQQYLWGLAKMIACLWVMYSIGFSIAGVKYPIFFAILCGLLELVPFVGNITGTTLTTLMALTQGSMGIVIGVLATYATVQFIQSYFLQPLVVGKGISINPVFTILAIVLGELVWGVAGMVLFLPLFAIVKIIFDKIPPLQPYGYLIGNEKSKGNDNG